MVIAYIHRLICEHCIVTWIKVDSNEGQRSSEYGKGAVLFPILYSCFLLQSALDLTVVLRVSVRSTLVKWRWNHLTHLETGLACKSQSTCILYVFLTSIREIETIWAGETIHLQHCQHGLVTCIAEAFGSKGATSNTQHVKSSRVK